MIRILLVLLFAVSALAPARPSAQEPRDSAGWNTERALELIQRAQLRRLEANSDTGLVNYAAQARAFVYFYLDRFDTGERNLVKTDQLALEVYWQSPDEVKQRIVGWRDEKSLPTNINYHLDHLSVVQENFGDEIRLGDGDEVRGVMHPAAPGAEDFYEFRLADSLTLRLPGAAEPVRVYELQVRPTDPSQPGFLGSVFVDRRQGDLVRMDFTFTSAAYVDRYLDYINISLDNGLWNGRFWLPNQQRVEIRRQIPQLDIPAGSVIRATLRIGDYELNEPLPPGLFAGPPVVAAPRAERERFEFEEDIHAEVLEEGIGPQVELGEIRRMAEGLVQEQALNRVAGLRLRVPRASEVLRYNRAEGLALNAGVTVVPSPRLRAGLLGGWAFGAEQPIGRLDVSGYAGETTLRGSLYLNRPRDVGVGPVAAGAINSLSALLAGRDYSDLFFADGGELAFETRLSPFWRLTGGARAERHSSAAEGTEFSVFGGDFRPVRAVDEGDLVGARLGLERLAPSGVSSWWAGSAAIEAASLNPGGQDCDLIDSECLSRITVSYLKPTASLTAGRRWDPRDTELLLDATAGAAVGELPRQALYLLGGRGTIPGYSFRRFAGDRYLAATATASADLWRPWVRGRLLGAAAWSGVGAPGEDALDRWGAETTGGVRPSLGIGAGLLHDILHVDLARGLGDGGEWELIVEVRRSFWDFL